jgi:hypothetical protein
MRFEEGNSLGGRKKGSKNKNKIRIDVYEILKSQEFCPFLEAVNLYRDEKTKSKVKQEILSDLQQYVAPKLKATQISADDGDGLNIFLNCLPSNNVKPNGES